MKLIQSKKASINYLSKVVNITTFRTHPNAEKLKCCTIDGFNIITGIDSQPGLYVYFPALSCINGDFLSYANLYRHKELNKDTKQSGMFEDNGRVKAIKLRGELSEGFILPVTVLENYIVSVTNKELENVTEGTEFDSVSNGSKEFWISKKYIAKKTYAQETPTGRITKKVPKGINKVIDTQFRFHYDSIIIKKYPNVITPESRIQLSYKIHGCVEANTIINTSEGPKYIKDIVDNRLPVEIEAFDINTSQKVFVPIDDYYTIPNDGDWYELELEDGRKLTITANNPVWLPELGCYRRTDELKIGDSVLISD